MENAASLTHRRAKAEDTNYCFWIKHSEACANVKTAAVGLVAALAAIALVGGVLLVLAQQGVNLAGINSLAQMVEAKWLYIGLGVASSVLLLDIIVIVALARSYLNRTFSEKELNKCGLTGYIQNKHISERMQRKTYWTLTANEVKASKKGAGKPAVFAIVTKDEKGKVTVSAYKTEDDRMAHIQQLGKGYHDGEKIFEQGNEYPAEYIVAILGDKFETEVDPVWQDLPEGFFRHKVIELDDDTHEQVNILAVTKNQETHLHFIKDGKEQEVFAPYTGSMDREKSDAFIESSAASHVKIPLKNKEFWPFDVVRVHYPPLFAVSMQPQDQDAEATICYYTKQEDRDAFIAVNCKPEDGWINAKQVFEQSPTYRPEDVPALVANDISGFTKRLALNNDEYYTQNFPTKDRNTIYAIAYKPVGQNIEYVYFKKVVDRVARQSSLPKTAVDRAELEAYLYGVNSRTGLIKDQNLENRCQKNEYFRCEAKIKSIDLYVMVFKNNQDRMCFEYWRNPLDRATAFTTGKYSAANGYSDVEVREKMTEEWNVDAVKGKVNAKDYDEAFKQNLLNTQFWAQDIKGLDGKTVYYALSFGDGVQPRFFKTNAARQKVIDASGRYSVNELRSCVNQTITTEQLSKKATQKYMYLKADYQINGKAVFVLIYPNEKINFFYRSFISDEERKAFLTSPEAKDYVEVGAVSAAPKRYEPAQVEQIITPDHLNIVTDTAARFAQAKQTAYSIYDIPTNDGKVVYYLAYSERQNSVFSLGGSLKAACVHFSTSQARQEFINTQLVGYRDEGAIERAFDGVPNGMLGPKGAIENYHLADFLLRSGDTFTFEFDANGKTQYAWVFRSPKDDFVKSCHENKEMRNAILTSPNIDLTPFIKDFNYAAGEIVKTGLQTQHSIQTFCVNDKDAWLEEKVDVQGKSADILFVNQGGKLRSFFRAPGSGSELVRLWSLNLVKPVPQPKSESQEQPKKDADDPADAHTTEPQRDAPKSNGTNVSEVKKDNAEPSGVKPNGNPPAPPMSSASKAAEEYTKDQASQLISEQHLKAVSAEADKCAKTKEKHYVTFDIPSTKGNHVVYALAYNDKGFFSSKKGEKFFTSSPARQTFINNQLNGFIDVGFISQLFYGVPEGMDGPKGVYADYHLRECLPEIGDTFTFEFQANGQTYFAWVTKTNKGLINGHDTKVEARNALFNDTQIKRKDLTPFIKGLDHEVLELRAAELAKARKEKCIKHQDSWLEQVDVRSQKVDILLVNWHNKFNVFCFEPGNSGEFVARFNLADVKPQSVEPKVELKEDQNPSGRLPDEPKKEANGTPEISKEYTLERGLEILLGAGADKTALTERENRMLPKEYWRLVKVAREGEEVYTLIIKHEDGKIEYHFFKTEDARSLHCQNIEINGYEPGFTRHSNNEQFALMRGKALGTQENKSCYIVYEYVDKGIAQIVSVSLNQGKWEQSSEYVDLKEVQTKRDQNKELLDIQSQITPLSQEEIYYIKKEIAGREALEDREYEKVLVLEGRYTALRIRHAGNDEKPGVEETLFNLTSDFALDEYIGTLNGYTEKK